jgi:hypothetical protein
MARPPAWKRSQKILREHGAPYPELLPVPAMAEYYFTLAAEKAEREALNERLRAICARGRAIGRERRAARVALGRKRLLELVAASEHPIQWRSIAKALGVHPSTIVGDRHALGITDGPVPHLCPTCGHALPQHQGREGEAGRPELPHA